MTKGKIDNNGDEWVGIEVRRAQPIGREIWVQTLIIIIKLDWKI